MDKEQRVKMQIGILRDLGYGINANTMILDLGCGNGDVVVALRKIGYQAFGCDFVFKEGESASDLEKNGFIKKILGAPYRLPFEDKTFDILLSDQVLEHVRDYSRTFDEIGQILKPGGVSLHIFPSRYTPIEPHVYVPLATVVQQLWWLKLWALFGIRTNKQQGMPAGEVAHKNYCYLREWTNYLTKKELIQALTPKFKQIKFCEDAFFKHSNRAKFLHYFSKVFRFLPGIYSTFRMRILLVVNR